MSLVFVLVSNSLAGIFIPGLKVRLAFPRNERGFLVMSTHWIVLLIQAILLRGVLSTLELKMGR